MDKYRDEKDLRRATTAKMFNFMAAIFMLVDAIMHTLYYAMYYFTYASEIGKEFVKNAMEVYKANPAFAEAIKKVAGDTKATEEAILNVVSDVKFQEIIKQAVDAGHGTEENIMTSIGLGISADMVGSITATTLQTAALALTFIAITQIVVGFIVLRYNNRLDKGNTIFRATIIQLIMQVIAYTVLFLNGFAMFEILLVGLMLSGCLLYSSITFLKLAKEYPDREWAVEPEKKKYVPRSSRRKFSGKKHVENKTNAVKASGTEKKKSIMERAKGVDNKDK